MLGRLGQGRDNVKHSVVRCASERATLPEYISTALGASRFHFISFAIQERAVLAGPHFLYFVVLLGRMRCGLSASRKHDAAPK